MDPFDLVLVAVDGSEESTRAVEYAVEVADAYDAAVHVAYVLGEDVAENYEDEGYAETAEEIADERGVGIGTSTVSGFSKSRLSQHPGSVVLDAAEERGADFIVLPREPQTGSRAAVLEKTAEYVLCYASQPVLSV
ncbi:MULTISPECIES: universal stress protein [Halolamina]|uniref:Nucleotide-binding universal stress protein, UspA family n=1 Tax=Halolamina pelagica TaxID=699431 RepID=A0A1I5TEK0_9EURY|nr:MULTISPECIES: universal stress protein [Halolamina]NHX37316.1 universal stress protein [Halolamina sp. R1-12]SFP81482.1 Nucleotide-binding universal stress protein, UspA family [Halolamina pelagica]